MSDAEAAADVEDLAGDKSGLFSEEEGNRRGHLCWMADASNRYPLDYCPGRGRGWRIVDGKQLSLNRPGCHGVNGDPITRKFERPSARQAHKPRLGRGVAASSELAQRGMTGKIDDPAPTPCAHAIETGLGNRDCGQDVEFELELQGVGCDLAEQLDLGDADIIDQSVDFAPRPDVPEYALQSRPVGEVGGMELTWKK